MKLTIFISVFLVACALADLQVGEPAEGDIVVASKHILRKGHSIIPSIAIARIGSPSPISAVSAVNAPGSNSTALIRIISGGIGRHHVLISAVSKPGEGIDVLVEVYAPPPPPPSSTVPPPPSSTTGAPIEAITARN